MLGEYWRRLQTKCRANIADSNFFGGGTKDEKALAGQVGVELKRFKARKLDDKKELPD